ncbi:MAG: efflux RND transporter periplasmic adaptor subunit [Peptococcaceae bacterium]|jgi:RND family efflux transporter MFP subunit|nr:efflux RND transporter periplasmic adaptor subunit [Peptococcaceae bacterium]MDH7523961.1 efflux RND transporter periplasmic adaptor subunit [Peptococcaceae bacterium]
MRRALFAGLLVLITGSAVISGCAADDSALKEKTKPVKVVELKEETYPVYLEYVGSIQPGKLKKYGFKISGRVGRVQVSDGQAVKRNDLLVSLDGTELVLAVKAAENTLDQARRAYEFSRDNYEKYKSLLEAGAISRQDADRARLDLAVQEAAYKNAEIDLENKRNILNDSEIRTEMDGFVAGIFVKEGEIAAAGYPAVAVRSENLIARVGVPQQDVGRISPGMTARVIVDGSETTGKVTEIAQLPDSQSRAYEVKVEIERKDFPAGAAARAVLKVGEERGVFIPITCILKSGRDFVFVVEEGKAVKREVTLGTVRGTQVMVFGLKDGEKLVVEGMKRLEDKDKVTIQP